MNRRWVARRYWALEWILLCLLALLVLPWPAWAGRQPETNNPKCSEALADYERQQAARAGESAFRKLEAGLARPDFIRRHETRVATLRADLDREKGRGFSLVEGPAPLGSDDSRSLYEALPKGARIYVREDGALTAGVGLRGDDNPLSNEQHRTLWAYVKWATETLNAALPADEQVEIVDAELRTSDGQSGIWRPDFHLDGDYLTASIALFGRNTLYVPESWNITGEYYRRNRDFQRLAEKMNARKDALEPAPGQVLFFSADDRAARFASVGQTWHASPPPHPRVLLLVRYRLKKPH